VAGDDPRERPLSQRYGWCEPCRALRVGTTWHPEADSPMCPRCTREWTPEPPLRDRVEMRARKLWRMPEP
jgi:hypothetical protein